jgi:hypothetical protein
LIVNNFCGWGNFAAKAVATAGTTGRKPCWANTV